MNRGLGILNTGFVSVKIQVNVQCVKIEPVRVDNNNPKFWTVRFRQTVQTQIRLPIEEQSHLGFHCLLL